MGRKPPQLIIAQKKLGRERCLGIYHRRRRKGLPAIIEIDPRQKPFEELDTVIHEAIHHAYPHLDEEHVRSGATQIAKVCWEYGYRLVRRGDDPSAR